MHDGQNLFLREEAFVGNTWRIDEVLGMLDRMNAIEEVIADFKPNDLHLLNRGMIYST